MLNAMSGLPFRPDMAVLIISRVQVICCQFVLLIHILFENVILTFFYEPDSHSLGLLIPQCVPRITFLNAVS